MYNCDVGSIQQIKIIGLGECGYMDKNRMQEFGNGHFHNGYYAEANKNMELCLRKIEFDDCNIISHDENMTECPYNDAYVFLHGSCDLFARALYERFRYEIYEIKSRDGKSNHWFGQFNYQGKRIYIDVRGATTDFAEFFSEFEILIGDDFRICLQNIEDQDIHVEWFDIGMQIAHKIINMHPEYYNFQ